MPKTLQDLKDAAYQRKDDGKLLEALKVLSLVLEGVPLDFDLRLEVGDLLAALQAPKFSAAVYNAVAFHNIKSGNPLGAMVAIKRLESLGINARPLVDLLAETYSAGSTKLGRGIRPAPVDYSQAVRDGIDLDYQIDKSDLLQRAAQIASYTDNIQNYPSVVPPVPIFSTLERTSFSGLLDRMELKRCRKDEIIIRQGKIGDAVYFLARGEVSVIKTEPDPQGGARELQLARLGPGSLFGEMALVSQDPRGASVICDTEVDVLELSVVNVNELAKNAPQVSGAMARFTRERMISNLLATNAIFKPFDDEMKKQLLGRFTGHEVPAGTIFLEQGSSGPGLYVILQGKAEVLKWDKGTYVKLANLGPGDVVGEISLIYDEPISATVRTTANATLLFLAKELFQPLVDAVPDLLAHFARLAKERLDDTDLKLEKTSAPDKKAASPSGEQEAELDEDEVIFI